MEKFKHLLNNHRIIALDTSCFIYYFEEKRYLKALEYLFSGIENGSFQALTSVLTITEILVKPQSLVYKMLLTNILPFWVHIRI